MKNIHLLPTDKPSRLRYNLSNILVLTKEAYRDYRKQVNQNIYITSDEEIKEGDWILRKDKIYKVRINKGLYLTLCEFEHIDVRADVCKKIILTTDQDLIKDGVQAIDDDFLEWFVKNPSCEYVKVNYEIYKEGVGLLTSDWRMSEDDKYKIIIPKEEQDYTALLKQVGTKQETLEEFAEKYSENWEETTGLDYENTVPSEVNKLDFINGAKWQAERMYSEKDIIDLIQFLSMNKEFNEYSSVSKETARYFLEQFKKK